MSSGGLSYSGLVNNGKITLPSVDSWGTNMNILRDPPKSYHTRKVDKVGDTNSITEMIDESSDRSCEAIKVYARGVNPFVSVSYSNNGVNNGGNITSNGLQQSGGHRSSKLPYTIMRDGAFRPPVLRQENLLPLSRLPRNTTSFSTKPGFADFSKKMKQVGTAKETKEVHNSMLKSFVRPTAVYNIGKPLKEPFEVKNVIQPSIKTSANSGVRSMDITQKYNGNPTKEVDNSPLHALAQSNLKGNKHVDNNKVDKKRYLQEVQKGNMVSNLKGNKHVDNNKVDKERYLQKVQKGNMVTNLSSKNNHTSIDKILDLPESELPIKDIKNIKATAPLSSVEQTKYFHDDIELSRSIPQHQARTNIGDVRNNKYLEHDNTINLERNTPKHSLVSNPIKPNKGENPGTRDVKLLPKVQPGGFTGTGQIPMKERNQNIQQKQDTNKMLMNKNIAKNIQERFGN